jgi:hypothetical protein
MERPIAFCMISSNLAGIPRTRKQPIRAHITITTAFTVGPNIFASLPNFMEERYLQPERWRTIRPW